MRLSKARKETPVAAKGSDEPYQGFAEIYDRVMCGVDYEGWADYVEQLLERYGRKPRRLVDLACGTGGSTLPFARRGYRVSAVDISEAMLRKARQKAAAEGLIIEFYRADLRSLELAERFDLAVLFQDGLNYLLDEGELARAIAAVSSILTSGGLFIFDLTRPGNRSGGEKNSICWADEEDFTLVWESCYVPEENLWEVLLTAFYRDGGVLYRKFQERHREKDYPPETVCRLLTENGFILRGLYPSFSLEPARGYEPKLTFVAEKKRGAEEIDARGPGGTGDPAKHR